MTYVYTNEANVTTGHKFLTIEFPACCGAAVLAHFSVGHSTPVHKRPEDVEDYLKKTIQSTGSRGLQKKAFLVVTLTGDQEKHFGELFIKYGFEKVFETENPYWKHNVVGLWVRDNIKKK